MKKMKNFKKIIFSIYLISAVILFQHLPSFSADEQNKINAVNQVKSTDNINENIIPSVLKGGTKSLTVSDIESLKKYAAQKSSLTQLSDDKQLDLTDKFNAFPKTLKTSLILRDIDVASILRIIAKEGGKNIVLDDSVQGIINADLKDISLNEAMQTILTSQELESRIEGNTIFVASRPAMARKGLNRKFIKAFKLNNANAVDVAKILEASIFNKGYTINNSSSGGSSSGKTSGITMQALENPYSGGASQPQANNVPAPAQNQANPVSAATSTGKSSIIGTKTIRGKVETIDPGSNFNDAAKLASEIKIRNVNPSIQDIDINNNDGGAIVIPDTRTNSILVAGLQQDILLAHDAIKYLDRALPQVSIEVSLIELTKTDSNEMGLQYGGTAGRFSSGYNTSDGTFNSNRLDPISTSSSSSSSGARLPIGAVTGLNQAGVVFSTVKNLTDDVAVKLNALLSTQKAKLLANPTVLALDGSESLIKITDQIVSRMTVTIEPTTQTTQFTPELSDIGIVLNILPKVGDNGYIDLRVRPSITTLKEKVIVGQPDQGGYANLISTREVILQDARIKSGETLAIAGLLKETDLKQISKIPFAGDLPIFGPLFRNTSIDHTKSELVILITPKIIDDIAYN